jgi:hypothetical protein
MRLLMTLMFVLLVSAAAFAQTTTTVYEQSYRVIDSVGNLVVFDFGYSTTATTTTTTTTTGRGVRTPRDPMTRITVIRPTGAPETREYAASFYVVGVGTRAVYAVASTTTTSGTTTTVDSKLVALNPQVSLPATLAAFTSTALPTTRFNVDMGQPDVISILTEAIRSSTTTGTTTTTTTSPRTVKVVKFNGTSFDNVSSATLP